MGKKKKVAVPKKPVEEAKENVLDAVPCSESTDICATISIPIDGVDEEVLKRLKLLIDSKASLMKKVFETENLDFVTDSEKITFEWFKTNPTPEEIHAYEVFVSKLLYMAKKQKRVQAKEKDVPSEKYAWRCFLLRLGLIGDEYKIDRKILLQNLSGSSSFREKKEGKEDDKSSESTD